MARGGSLGGLQQIGAAAPSGPDLSQMRGPELQWYWNARADDMDAAEKQKGEDAVRAYGATGDLAAASEQQMANHQDTANMLRLRGMPDWRGELASLSGKQVSGFGEPGFQEGRIAPGTSDVVEPVGRSYANAEFDDSARDPSSPTGFARGSMASRSGLSTQALRLLAGLGH